MKNLIVSFEKLPRDVKQAVLAEYPEGFDQHLFDFRVPNQNRVYKAIRFCLEEVNYLIKIEKKKMDRPDVMDTI